MGEIAFLVSMPLGIWLVLTVFRPDGIVFKFNEKLDKVFYFFDSAR